MQHNWLTMAQPSQHGAAAQGLEVEAGAGAQQASGRGHVGEKVARGDDQLGQFDAEQTEGQGRQNGDDEGF